MRRLVEEAALLGIPSIVVDCANDLVTLDERWANQPDTWTSEDREKADNYHEQLEMIVWTPGRESGNPLTLDPLPDLAALVDNNDELEAAIAMTRESLGEVVAKGESAKSSSKR